MKPSKQELDTGRIKVYQTKKAIERANKTKVNGKTETTTKNSDQVSKKSSKIDKDTLKKIEKVDKNREERKEKFRQWKTDKINELKWFVMNNKEFIIVFGPIVIGTLGKIIKYTGKQITISREKNNKELYCYDRSLGHYWKLRRELTNDEWVKIDNRKTNGERLADILDEMKVLR